MGKYDTKLSKEGEKQFEEWFSKSKNDGVIHPNDNGNDYDFRGFWKNIVNSDNKNEYNSDNHFPDTYKKPNHETFSNESKYAKGKLKEYAGKWENDKFINSKKKFNERTPADILYDN